MQFEYILLCIIFFFPFLYKIFYWANVFEDQGYRLSESEKYLLSPRGFKKIYHFWVFIEAPLLAMSFVIFFDPPFEILLYNFVFYFGVLYNIFVFGKIVRGRFHIPDANKMLFATIILFIAVGIKSISLNEKYIYIFLTFSMFLMPLYFLFIEFLRRIIRKFLKVMIR